MAEYIDREKMLKYLEETNTSDEWIVNQYNADWIYSFIESQPCADVVETKYGEWEAYGLRNPKCSICHIYNFEKSRYCPNCGARMDGTPKERGGEK